MLSRAEPYCACCAVQDSKDYYGLAPGKSVMLRWVPGAGACRTAFVQACLHPGQLS